MTEQVKILRIFKLIELLKKRPRSIDHLSEMLEVTTRTVYRYFELLESIGFIIEKDFNNLFFIADYSSSNSSEGMNFDTDEAELLHQLVQTGAYKHPLKESILKKLFVHSELSSLTEDIINARTALLIRKLQKSMENEHQVILENYHSAHTSTISNRLVEVVSFSVDYEQVFAYEVSVRKMKTFKTDRIGGVNELDIPMKNKKEHQAIATDIFGMSGVPNITVYLKMSFQAYLLIIKEFPKSRQYLSILDKSNKTYQFKAKVSSFEGIGRFILGLIDQITIDQPPELQNYIDSKILEKADVDTDCH